METPFDAELWASKALKFIHKENDNPGPIIQILVCLECGHFNGFSRHVLELLKYGMIGIECGGCKKDILRAQNSLRKNIFTKMIY